MKWTELKIKIHEDMVELVSDILYDKGAKGISIEGDLDYEELQKEGVFWDYIDEDLLENKSSLVDLKTYFSEEEYEDVSKLVESIEEEILDLEAFGFDVSEVSVGINLVDQKEWEDNWKQYFKPIKITDKIVVQPEWEDYEADGDELVLKIDPGMAFGTGSHETTSMCMKAIEKYAKTDDTLLDIGCGSGILAMTGVLLGCKKAVGVDFDPVAVRVAKENIELNKLVDKIEILHGNLADEVDESFEIVVANIIADVIVILCDDINKYMKDNAYFICSGIIHAKLDMVVEKIKEVGLELVEVVKDGEWCAVVAQKK